MSTRIEKFLSTNKKLSVLYLLIRLYVGYQWLAAGIPKLLSPTWIGSQAGVSLTKFLSQTLTKTTGAHPEVMSWYAYLTKHIFLPMATEMSYLIVLLELVIGLSILLGLQIKKGAFLGAFLNFNFLLAGSLSLNPILLLLEIILIFGNKVSGYLGLDGFLARNSKKPLSPSD